MKVKTFNSIILVMLVLIGCQSCLQKKVKGNGTVTENIVPIADYTSIEIDGEATLFYEQKDTIPYLRIEVDENIFPLLSIEVNSDGRLKIENTESHKLRPTVFNIYTNSRGISSMEFNGSSKTTLKGKVTTSSLKVEIAGSGTLTADSLICDVLEVEIAGSGNINLTGKATRVSFDVSGSGKVEALNFIANNVSCDVAGSGKIAVTALEVLDIDIAGSGNVQYKGSPTINQSITGSGKITKLDTDDTNITIGVGSGQINK